MHNTVVHDVHSRTNRPTIDRLTNSTSGRGSRPKSWLEVNFDKLLTQVSVISAALLCDRRTAARRGPRLPEALSTDVIG